MQRIVHYRETRYGSSDPTAKVEMEDKDNHIQVLKIFINKNYKKINFLMISLPARAWSANPWDKSKPTVLFSSEFK